MEKLCHTLLKLLEKAPHGRTRTELAKLLYYADGVFFQRHLQQITNSTYIHTEDAPEPLGLMEAIVALKAKGNLTLEPFFSGEGIQGFRFRFFQALENPLLTKEELRILSKVCETFRDRVQNESSHYPNLYENYVVTPLYEEIPFREDRINTKVHIFSQKNLLNVSGKLYRVFFERSSE